MEVLDPNDIKIYNLTVGKSIPEWISDWKKRRLAKKDVDIRRRIELIQDFEMPGLSTSIKMCKDGHHILATGVYKPRVRCYDVDNLSLKFERCFDSEVITFETLADDYSKIAFLQHDRYVELHAKGGRYFRLRVPKFGRDIKYHFATCDLLVAGVGSEIYRLNLERGQFLLPWTTEASEVSKLAINPCHQLVVAGTKEGKVEAWDPRARQRVATLDPALHCIANFSQLLEGFPSVTSVEFNNALTMLVGVATGQVLVYDIRSNKPALVKDHMYNRPIKDIAVQGQNVLSMDSACVKIWDKNDGKLMTFIESGAETLFNNLCHVPNSGLMFIANENTKILSYYIPALAPAPRWCSFLDNLTEELEESKVETVYDDFKFLTKSEILDLGLGHLLGTSMAKAYMHGFFVNVRLWKKAKEATDPFNYDDYKKKKLKEKLEAQRPNRVQITNLPKVNKELALKLMDEKSKPKKKKTGPNLLEDDRFKAMFENPDFEVNTASEEFRLLNPVISRLDSARRKELQKEMLREKFDLIQDDDGKKSSDDDDILGESPDESTDDEREWANEVREEHRKLKKEKWAKEREEEKMRDKRDLEKRDRVKMYQLKRGQQFDGGVKALEGVAAGGGVNRLPLADRLKDEDESSRGISNLARGNKEITFKSSKDYRQVREKEDKLKHQMERKKLARKAPYSNVRINQPWYGKKR